MRKVIAAMNMTFDGFCDHTLMIADDEIHEHYNEMLRSGGILLYGRITYQLMESFWPGVVKNPTGNKPMDDFAILIDNIPKVVFSKTLKDLQWKNSVLAKGSIEEEISVLKSEPGNDIYLGSPSLIASAANRKLVDEYQILVQPIIAGKGLTLFKNIQNRIDLALIKTKTFTCGAVTFYFHPTSRTVDE